MSRSRQPRQELDWRERLRIHWNFLRVVLPQFKFSLLVFVVVNVLGSLVIWAESDGISFPHALHSALALNMFEVGDGFPEGRGFLIQAVYFLLPAIGVIVVGEGLIRLGVLILERKAQSKEWNMALAQSYRDHVVIAGLGRVGSRVAKRLQRTEKLVCIEATPNPEHSDLSENVAVITGDATRLDVLEQANVAQARAILVLTDDDLANLEIAVNARELNPELRVVLRMFNERLGRRLVESFGFEAVFSTSALAAPSFSAALYNDKILQTIEVGEPDEAVHLAKVVVGRRSPLVGRTILEVEGDSGVSVVLHHTSESHDLLPSANARICDGDTLFVLSELDQLDAFDRLAVGPRD